MNKQYPIDKRIKAITLSLFLFSAVFAAENLWAQIAIMPLGDSITYDDRRVETRPVGERTGYRQPLWLDHLIDSGYDVDFVGGVVAGQLAVPAFDPDNEGHPGYHADGGPLNENIFPDIYGWLVAHPPDVILLHIGTNDIGTTDTALDIATDIDRILDEIDRYGAEVWVILARIIKRAPVGNALNPKTTDLNNTIQVMADSRIDAGDKIIVVDMENSAGLSYIEDPTAPYSGDMYDDLHPNVSGYEKMAATWFADGLAIILPVAEAGPDQIVNEGDPVQLDGAASNVPIVQNGNFLVEWIQTAGLAVNLDNPNILTPTFTAPPDVGASGSNILRFRLSISDVDNANIADADIVDVTVNDVPVVPVDIVVADVTGDEGTGLEFTVTLNNAVAGGFDVSVNFTDGTATGGEDYADDAVTLTFLGTAGETQTFTVATFDDAVVEGAEAETFTVSLSASHANVNDSDTAVGRIIDNDSDNNIINTVSNGGGGGGGCFIQTVSGLFN